jgi:hypothetical protein
MQVHFAAFVAHADSPGVILIPSSRSIGDAIEALIVVWLAGDSTDLENQIRWI